MAFGILMECLKSQTQEINAKTRSGESDVLRLALSIEVNNFHASSVMTNKKSADKQLRDH